MTSSAPGTVIVISAIGIPERCNDSAAYLACSADFTRTAGMIAISSMRARTSSLFTVPAPWLRHEHLSRQAHLYQEELGTPMPQIPFPAQVTCRRPWRPKHRVWEAKKCSSAGRQEGRPRSQWQRAAASPNRCRTKRPQATNREWPPRKSLISDEAAEPLLR